KGNGYAHLMHTEFENGIIEYDVNFPAKRGFFGAHFRIADNKNFEEFYMRAHQSGNPDAMQYTPVYNGLAGWQLYHGPGFGAPKKWDFDTWTHVKLVIQDDEMEVFIGDMETPVLHAFELERKKAAGGLGLYTFLATPRFANFTYQKLDKPGIKSKKPEMGPIPQETVEDWELSQPMNGKELEKRYTLPQSWKRKAKWEFFSVEMSGTLNMAQRAGLEEDAKTMMARFKVKSGAVQTKGLILGYSDAARVYVNGKLVYGGHKRFRTRDYRYLGTIGDFDTVYLPLVEGENEIIIAVTEQMGGWGIRARWENMENLAWTE
ncbi:MAG: hypothetical protein AAFV07_02350, partial [Bacteroidota bacterium]